MITMHKCWVFVPHPSKGATNGGLHFAFDGICIITHNSLSSFPLWNSTHFSRRQHVCSRSCLSRTWYLTSTMKGITITSFDRGGDARNFNSLIGKLLPINGWSIVLHLSQHLFVHINTMIPSMMMWDMLVEEESKRKT